MGAAHQLTLHKVVALRRRWKNKWEDTSFPVKAIGTNDDEPFPLLLIESHRQRAARWLVFPETRKSSTHVQK